MARKNKSGIPGVRGKRTEGTLLAVPVQRIRPKSETLLRFEALSAPVKQNVTQLRKTVK